MGGIIFEKFHFTGIFTFCSILMFLWLILALFSPAPLAVKTIAYTLPERWQNDIELLQEGLKQFKGIQEIAFTKNHQVLHLKIMQKTPDLTALQNFILGEDHVSK